MKNQTVVIMGNAATALAVVREIKANFTISVVLVAATKGTAGHSKYISEFWPFTDKDSLLERLNNRAQKHQLVLLPCSDQFIEWIDERHQGLDNSILFSDSYGSGLAARFLNKENFSVLAKQHSAFAEPYTQSADTFDQSYQNKEQLMPVFIKPKLIHQLRDIIPGKKGIIVKDMAQWKLWRERYKEGLDQWLVQEIIKGADDQIMLYAGYMDAKGRAQGSITARKVRQFPPGFGSASLVLSEYNQELIEKSESFLQKTGYRGICCGEFKWCQSRQDWVVIEFNPRPTLWYAVNPASGSLVASHLLADLLGLEIKQGDLNYGKLWKYGLKDFASAWFYRLKGKGFVLPAPTVKNHVSRADERVWPVFQWSDPTPFIFELWQYLKKFVQRIFT